MKAQLPCRGVPRADTKITVGFGPQAAALKLASWTASHYVQFICAAEGVFGVKAKHCP
jgi:hypothetical protein